MPLIKTFGIFDSGIRHLLGAFSKEQELPNSNTNAYAKMVTFAAIADTDIRTPDKQAKFIDSLKKLVNWQ